MCCILFLDSSTHFPTWTMHPVDTSVHWYINIHQHPSWDPNRHFFATIQVLPLQYLCFGSANRVWLCYYTSQSICRFLCRYWAFFLPIWVCMCNFLYILCLIRPSLFAGLSGRFHFCTNESRDLLIVRLNLWNFLNELCPR